MAPMAPGAALLSARDVRVAAVAIGVALAALAWTFYFDEVPAALAQSGMQPAAFPRLVVGLIVALSLLVGAQGFRRARAERETPPSPVRPMVHYTLALTVGLLALATTLGFVVMMFAVCLVMPLLWGERRYWLVAAYAVLVPAAVNGLFAGIFSVKFPPGLFGRWFG